MLFRPSLRRHLSTHVVEGQGVLLWAGPEQHLLTGPVFERIIPLLDGSLTADQLADELAPEFSPEEVYYALIRLRGTDVIRETGDLVSPSVSAYWDSLGVAPDLAVGRLALHSVSVKAVGGVDGGHFAAGLAAMGLVVDQAGVVDVVVVDDYLHRDLGDLNREALATGRRWLLARPLGTELWLGPLFVPGVTACWACLAHRIRQHRPVDAFLADTGAAVAAVGARGPATSHLALGLLGTSLVNAVATDRWSDLEGELRIFETIRGIVTHHPVVRRPQCAVCGDPGLYAEQANTAPGLRSRPKAIGLANEQRSEPLAATYRRFRRHVGAPTGVITGLTAHHATGAPAIHAVSAGPIVALRYRGLDGLRAGLASTNAGKGTTRLRARVSALGEALERHSGVYQGDEPRIRSRLAELEGAIDPNRCMHFSETQYQDRARRNALSGPADRIPGRFDPGVPSDWTPLWSLTTGKKAFLPTMLVYHDYPATPDERTCVATSNGAASGNCLEEAVLHGLLELIERDCVAMWWYNRVTRPAVDLTGLEDKFTRRMRRAYASLGREWWLLDLTNDLEIPCYAAVSRRVGGGPEEPLFGFGAHLDPAIALRRALTELNQVVVARDGRNTPFSTDPRMASWLADATVSRHPYLAPRVGAAERRDSLATDDVHDDLILCVDRLVAAGLDPLVLDQTRPDIGVPVARVVVPELRNFRVRLAPGRLYTVPQRLGWIPRECAEGDLNPVGFIL